MDPFQKIVSRAAGIVLLVFGFALAGLLILVLVRQSGRLGAVGFFGVGLMAIAALCFLFGYRLAFNRPNRRGTLLSPIGWKVLAAAFAILAVVIGWPVTRNIDYVNLVGAAATALLAYACVLAARGVRLESPQPMPPSRIYPTETCLLQVEGFTPAGFRFGVEILNDDRTPMEFVVSVLRENLGLPEADAIRVMLEIHSKGGVLLARDSLEESERVAEAVAARARAGDHPLICRAVGVSGDEAL